MKQLLACLMLLSVVLAMPVVQAKEAATMAADPVLEKRVMALSYELRCLVCQNQSLGGSQSDFAIDLRNEIRQQMSQGKSDQQVTDFMVERYGDFILFKPPVKSTTLALWIGPFALLAIGALVLFIHLKRRKRTLNTTPLSDEDHKRAEALLDNK